MKGLYLYAAALLAHGAHASYPATYPFDNEVFPFGKIDSLPVPTPELALTFDDNDPGGYVVHGFELCDLNLFVDTMGFPGFSWSEGCYGPSYYFVKGFGLAPVFPAVTWNCTGRPRFSEESFTGQMGDANICDSCCQDVWGQEAYSIDDIVTWTEFWGTTGPVGGCAVPDEQTYCNWMTHGYWHCSTSMLSTTERTAIRPCWINSVFWYNTCTVYNSVGWREISYVPNMEPVSYLDQLSTSQQSYILAFLDNPDRICHPPSHYGETYNVYFPDADSESSGILYMPTLVTMCILFFTLPLGM